MGGGIALGISVRFGIEAITFDPSHRIFGGLGDHQNANRIVIYQEGEILTDLRKMCDQMPEIIQQGNVYKTKYDFDGENNYRGDFLGKIEGGVLNHRADLLAKGLIEQGKTSNPTLQVIYDSLAIK